MNCNETLKRFAVAALASMMLSLAPAGLRAEQSPGGFALLRRPTISHSQIAFSYGGDLWIVDRKGGEARRLTSDIGIETSPAFSPDGSMLAFTGEYDGNEDVYVVSETGGIPKRLTSHPGADQVVGWTRDGKRVLFRSARNSYAGFMQLFTVSIDGGLPEVLPLPMAEEGSYSPDSSHLAYVPFTNFQDNWGRLRGLKHYRGGKASPVWVANLADSSVEKLPRKDSNDSTPMWIGDRIYFLSDRNGPVNLYGYDINTKQVSEVIHGNGEDIKSASAGPDAIVYEQFGSIHVFDPGSGREHTVSIQVTGDFPATRAHFVPVADRIQAAAISPTGARALFEAHGDILSVPVEHGDIRNLTHSPAAADRDPAWSPDGRWIAYFSDEGGEYALYVRSQDGVSPAKRIDLGSPASFFYSPLWSPDSKRIVYSDKRLNLWLVDVDGGRPTLIATNPYEGGSFNPDWSADSRWIVYTRQLDSTFSAVFIYGLEDKSTHQITDGLSDAASAVFDRSGRYIYFLASTDVGPAIASSMGAFKVPVTHSAYIVVLSKTRKSPLAPQSDEEKSTSGEHTGTTSSPAPEADECASDAPGDKPDEGSKEGVVSSSAAAKEPSAGKRKGAADKPADKPSVPVVAIDFKDIDQRILALPIQARNYDALLAGKTHVLFLLEGPAVNNGVDPYSDTVHRFNLCTRKSDRLLESVGHFYLSANAEKALYEELPKLSMSTDNAPHGPGQWFIKPVDQVGKPADPDKPDGKLKLDSAEVFTDPRAEWNQMFHEVWRVERDFFYDPNLHGLNLKAQMAAYQPYVDHVMSRADLNYIFADMLGDITAQHVYISGGDRPAIKHVSGGLLGADYTIVNGRYRFAHVYHGENWNPSLRAPLTEPGVNVVDGEYLLAVNGRELRGSDEIYSLFEETAGKAVTLRVGPDPQGQGARDVSVVPIANESSLRLRAWMDANRRKVDELSGGRLAYVYLPDTAVNGFTNFNRYYFAQADKQGAVIDERFNGGGWIADYIVDWLQRPLLASAMTREGKDQNIPNTIRGPKVMLINQHAGSGGDALPWMFKRLGTGPLIGTRTWGGLIGIGGYPPLLDGGGITAPRYGLFNPDSGEFDVENHGISPDIEVELDPALVRRGHDPQLERAVAVALEQLQQHPIAPVKRPKYPIYNWSQIRSQAAEANPPAAQK
jgi:tricorn protease